MTPLFEKKVRSRATHSGSIKGMLILGTAVCVSALMVKEIKRIIKESEIMKSENLSSYILDLKLMK